MIEGNCIYVLVVHVFSVGFGIKGGLTYRKSSNMSDSAVVDRARGSEFDVSHPLSKPVLLQSSLRSTVLFIRGGKKTPGSGWTLAG